MAVKANVGVMVCVAVKVGGSGVNVNVAVSLASGVPGTADCVNAPITVPAMVVLSAFISGGRGVAATGAVTQARVLSKSIKKNAGNLFEEDIILSFIYTSRSHPEYGYIRPI